MGQGPLGRQPDDQRPGRDPARQAGLQAGGAVPALPGARRTAGTSGRRARPRSDAKGKPRKQPFFIHPVAEGPIAFAGVYELWRNPAVHPDDPAAWLATYAVITTDAEPGLDVIHDRMPLVLPRDRWDDWLDPQLRDPDAVRALLQPPAPGRFLATAGDDPGQRGAATTGLQLLEPAPTDQLRGVVDPATGELIGGGDCAALLSAGRLGRTSQAGRGGAARSRRRSGLAMLHVRQTGSAVPGRRGSGARSCSVTAPVAGSRRRTWWRSPRS